MSALVTTVGLNTTSKFKWMLHDIRIEKIILAPVWAPKWFSKISEVSALLNVRHCPRLQSSAISRKTNEATLRKCQKPMKKTFFMGFSSTNS